MEKIKTKKNIKYIIEILVIIIFLSFVEFYLLSTYKFLTNTLYFINLSVIAFELIISMGRNLYYKLNKIKNKIIYISILLISIIILFSTFNKVIFSSSLEIYSWIMIIGSIILCIYLIINGMLSTIDLYKERNNLGKNIIRSFFSFLGALLTLISFLFYVR